jgi:putative FmdB family regulatory protein
MAFYDYECADCKKKFTVKHSFEEHDRHEKILCPKCKGRHVRQLVAEVHVQTARKS